jgi:hypothetical protein
VVAGIGVVLVAAALLTAGACALAVYGMWLTIHVSKI